VGLKFRVGDYAKLPDGSVRAIIAIEPTRHGRHAYYAFRQQRHLIGRRTAIGVPSPRSCKLAYWVRSDKLSRISVQERNRLLLGRLIGRGVGRPRRKRRAKPVWLT